MSEPKEFTLKATPEDINTIFAVLVKLPWETANPLISKFDAQIKAQMAKPATAPTPKPAPPAAVDEAPSDDELLADVEPAPPARARRVQDEPDPLPRRRPNGRAAVEADLAAEALGEPTRGRV